MFAKKACSIMLSVIISAMVITPAGAISDTSEWTSSNGFPDVPESHWAYDAIMHMSASGIICGYKDGTFRPDNAVTRSEFAKMMVLALNINLTKPAAASFIDVSHKDWEYQYVESARFYLTGFRTASGDYFKPAHPAVREDMAVALVKAGSIDTGQTNISILDAFNDASLISPNLKKYVAAAAQAGLINGYPVNGGNESEFRPQNTLTRAECAMLLYRCLKEDEEKVTYDEQKVTYQNDDEEYTAPAVSYEVTENGHIRVMWQAIEHPDLKGCKVVLSKSNSSPAYPADGYLVWITDKSRTSHTVKAGDSYQNGDLGGSVKSGVTYYISVTAVYKNDKVRGNSMPVEF